MALVSESGRLVGFYKGLFESSIQPPLFRGIKGNSVFIGSNFYGQNTSHFASHWFNGNNFCGLDLGQPLPRFPDNVHMLQEAETQYHTVGVGERTVLLLLECQNVQTGAEAHISELKKCQQSGCFWNNLELIVPFPLSRGSEEYCI